MDPREKSKEKGFALWEVLAVAAIVALLLTVAVPSVLDYARKIKLTELDGGAMALYMAAQNRLNAMISAGEDIDRALEGREPARTAAPDGTARRFVSNAAGGAGRFAGLLPALSVDQALLAHSWTVEYDALTGAVYAVWYWEAEGFDYREVMNRPEEGGPGYDRAADLTLRENRAREGLMVGFYGGDGVERDGVRRMPPFDMTVVNGEELALEIVTHAPAASDGGIDGGEYLVDVSVNGFSLLTGQRLSPENTGRVVLDTLKGGYARAAVKTDGTGFTVGAPYKIWREEARKEGVTLPLPGADILLTVTLRHAGNAYLPRVMKASCNSLFAGVDGKTALIGWGRHLQNLDCGVSGVNDGSSGPGGSDAVTVTAARQIADIDFKGAWDAVYGYEELLFTPITNHSLTGYDGGSFTVRYLNAGMDRDEFTGERINSGLFAAGYELMLEDIELVNPNADGYCAGALIGSAGPIAIENCHAYLDAQGIRDAVEGRLSIRGENGGSMSGAGGLTGITYGTQIRNSSASLVVEGLNAGGLVGWGTGGGIWGSYAAGHITGTRFAGGLMGDGEDVSVTHSYAAGILSCVDGARAGGVAGSGSLTVTDSYAAALFIGRKPGSAVYGVCPETAARFIRQDGVTYAENSGTPAARADPASLGLAGEGWELRSEKTSTLAYRLTEETRRLAVYPYPRPDTQTVHYGDWLEWSSAVPARLEGGGGP